MSNQNAGADRQSCAWCQLWQVAYLASRLDWRQYRKKDLGVFEHFPLAIKWLGHQLVEILASRETDCSGCRRSAEIQRGNVLGHQQAAWRAAMYEQNPVMRQFMRPGKHDTFTEAGRDAGRDHAT